MRFKFTVLAIALGTLGGCASPSLTIKQMKATNEAKTTAAVAEFEKTSRPVAAVREIREPMVDFKKTEQVRIRGDVNIQAAGAPFAPILSELGRKAGYSVAYAESVDAGRKVTVNFNEAVTEDAIRTTAFLAGYAAVIDKTNRTIMVSDVATYTFRLPSGVFSALQAQYSVGGNPANSSSGGGQSGGSAGGTSLRAEFAVQGKEGSNPMGVTKFLQDIAGKNAEVYVTDSGHVSVRANAQALRRVHEFMKGFSRDAMTQVEIEASVVEVALAKDFALGIQWGKVVENAAQGMMLGGSASQSLAGALTGQGPGGLVNQMVAQATGGAFSAFKVGVNTSSIITALSKFTDINIVSQPKLVSMNNVPATFFDGTQLPYLGSIQQTAGSAAGSQPTVTGSVAFAIDGVSFSAIPSVVDSNTVQITLIPVLSSVNGFESFLNDTLKAPRQGNKQTYMRVLAESGKTLILGGIRYNKDTKDTSYPNSTAASSTSKEVVILLRTNVIPAPVFDPIVSESL